MLGVEVEGESWAQLGWLKLSPPSALPAHTSGGRKNSWLYLPCDQPSTRPLVHTYCESCSVSNVSTILPPPRLILHSYFSIWHLMAQGQNTSTLDDCMVNSLPRCSFLSCLSPNTVYSSDFLLVLSLLHSSSQLFWVHGSPPSSGHAHTISTFLSSTHSTHPPHHTF